MHVNHDPGDLVDHEDHVVDFVERLTDNLAEYTDWYRCHTCGVSVKGDNTTLAFDEDD